MSGQTMRNDPGLGIPRTIFGPEHELFRDTVRRFLEAEIMPYHEAWEEVRLVPREAWLKAGETGLLGTSIAEEYGGSGAGFLFDAISWRSSAGRARRGRAGISIRTSSLPISKNTAPRPKSGVGCRPWWPARRSAQSP